MDAPKTPLTFESWPWKRPKAPKENRGPPPETCTDATRKYMGREGKREGKKKITQMQGKTVRSRAYNGRVGQLDHGKGFCRRDL